MASSSFGVEGRCLQVCPLCVQRSPPAPRSRQAEQRRLVQGQQPWEGGGQGKMDPFLSDCFHTHSLPSPTRPSRVISQHSHSLGSSQGDCPGLSKGPSTVLPQCLCSSCASHSAVPLHPSAQCVLRPLSQCPTLYEFPSSTPGTFCLPVMYLTIFSLVLEIFLCTLLSPS